MMVEQVTFDAAFTVPQDMRLKGHWNLNRQANIWQIYQSVSFCSGKIRNGQTRRLSEPANQFDVIGSDIVQMNQINFCENKMQINLAQINKYDDLQCSW